MDRGAMERRSPAGSETAFSSSSRARLACAILLLAGGTAACRPAESATSTRGPEQRARAILEETGIRRGLALVLGDATGRLSIELARESELLVYLQLTRAEDLEAAVRAVDDAGLFGQRVWVGGGSPQRLHLADDLADLLVAVGEAAAVAEDEALRAVRPGGTLILGETRRTKPPLEGADDWTHPYHGPDNNPQSEDQVARAPYLTSFLADPRYAPLPQVAVASGGRLFKAFGNVAFKRREEPWLNQLVAFNGYNGTILWTRSLTPGYMIHRNTLIATPDTVYVADDRSCKLVDAATGRLRGEIRPPVEVAGGTFWKWMALENGVLYALIGEDEPDDPVERHRSEAHGWSWGEISKGYNAEENPWGFGRNLLAIDLETEEILWSHREEAPADSRALCMKSGRIHLFRPGSYLVALDAGNGEEAWRNETPELFEALGPALNRQGWVTNWRTACYLKCSERALYFSGPQVGKLLAVSAEGGHPLWEHPYDNYQLVLREQGLYGISGQAEVEPSRLFDPLTGEVLAEMDVRRRACSRPTGSPDALLFRASGGSVRLDVESGLSEWISPMRAQCQDGVTIAGGRLYWWPSVCDCNLTIYGVTCLGPAGDFDFRAPAVESERLERLADPKAEIEPLEVLPEDWPTFRANNACTATSRAAIPPGSSPLWTWTPPEPCRPTAPVAAGGLVLLGGDDGIVRALDAASGELRWSAHTGGGIRIPPTLWNGRALVGSGDGHLWCLEALTGRTLWRFRAAPIERRIPVYGRLLSTWPVSSGVLVEDGTAYLAAGIVNYDGTHVFALNAATGELVWHNGTSGHLDERARTGVCVQGHLLLEGDRLHLAGGTAVSPAVYDKGTGECLNEADQLADCEARGSRGWELYRIGGKVVACGRPYYSDPRHGVYDPDVFSKLYVASSGARDVVLIDDTRLMSFAALDRARLAASVADRSQQSWFSYTWGELDLTDIESLWGRDVPGTLAVATCSNAVIIAREAELRAVDLEGGEDLWVQPLPAPPVRWGLAVDRAGRCLVTLEDGRVLCFGSTD